MDDEEVEEVIVEVKGEKIPLREFIACRAKHYKLQNLQDNRLTVKNLNYHAPSPSVGLFSHVIKPKTKKEPPVILKDISFSLEPREMTLLFGGPSSGKTSLFDVIAQRRPHESITGEIKLNNEIPDPKTFHRDYSYVVQRDIHFDTLTVWETIYFSAVLQMDPHLNEDDIRMRVDIVLQLLGLTHAKDTLVGGALLRGISGGEKRRLSIAVEWVKGPSFFMLDEPTTGLDASAAFRIANDLKAICAFGTPVLCALYQPSVELFSLFDKLIILSRGEIAYWGPVDWGVDYFLNLGFHFPETYTPPEFLSEVVEYPEKFLPEGAPPITPEDLIQIWKDSELKVFMHERVLNRDFEPPPPKQLPTTATTTPSEGDQPPGQQKKSVYAKPRNVQMKMLLWRSAKMAWRDKLRYAIRVGNEIVIAVLIGLFFLQLNNTRQGSTNKLGLLFFALTHLGFSGLASIPYLFAEREVFYYQRVGKYYATSPFFVSVILMSLPLAIVETILFGTIIYWMAGLNPAPNRYFFFLLILFALFLTSQAYARLVASLMPNPMLASLVGSTILNFFILFSGFLIPRPQIPDGWVWAPWASFYYYPTSALATNEFAADFPTGEDLRCSGSELAPPNGFPLLNVPYPEGFSGQQVCPWESGEDLLDQYGWFTHLQTRWGMFGATIGFSLGFLVLAYIVLRTVMYSAAPGKPTEVKKKPHKPVELSSFVPSGHKSFLTWQNLQYSVDDKVLLKEQYGYVKPGMLLALMGASGAGKSTLLDVLALRKTGGKIEGQMLLNGKPIDKEKYHRYIGYVEQVDIHYPHQTVEEALEFSAKTRLSNTVTKEQRRALVQRVMNLLDLGRIANTVIGMGGSLGGLNPEQRKRVSIGVELCSNPQILFLDEPTSGLDAAGADKVMTAIQKVALSGTAVICTIHQPSQRIFFRMTHLLLLAPGGQTVYFGEAGERAEHILQYFHDTIGADCPPYKNPADFVLKMSGNPDLIQVWKNSPRNESVKADLTQNFQPLPESEVPTYKRKYPLSWIVQFAVVWKRFAKIYTRAPQFMILSFIRAAFLGVVIGTAFYQLPSDASGVQRRAALIFFSAIYTVLAAFASVIPLIMVRPLYYKERAQGIYHSSAFAIAKIVFDIPGMVIEAAIFICPVYFIAGLRYEADRFFFFYGVMVGLFLASSALGQMIAVISPNVESAGLLFSTAVTTFIISSGFLLPRPSIRNYWIWIFWIDYLQYGIQANLINEVQDRTFGCPGGSGAIPVPITLVNGMEEEQLYCPIETGQDVLNIFGFYEGLKWGGFFAVYGFFLVFLGGMLLGLRFISYQKR